MKVTLVVLACMALAGFSAAYVPSKIIPENKGIAARQLFLFQAVYGFGKPTQFEEISKLGTSLITDQSQYVEYVEAMVKFYNIYKIGGLLPKGEFFSVVQEKHIKQALGLFSFFYYAKDWEVFAHNVAWARINVNEGMFIYALTLAVIHRQDMQGLTLPPIYEINPRAFYYSKFIDYAETFNMDVFNRQMLLGKELGSVFGKKYATDIFKDRFYLKDWKVWQWWKLMGLEEDWHVEEKCVQRNNIEVLQNDPKFKALWDGVKIYWMPVDYTRDVGIFNEESKLSYFTEDVGLNSYWYYLNMYYPTILGGKTFHLNDDRRGEFWLFNIQQLLARYNAERHSVGLGDIEDLSFYGIVKDGYDPQLIAYGGNGYTFRKNYFELYSYQNVKVLNQLTAITRRINDFIDSGKYVTKDGKVIDLLQPEAIDIVGNLLQGNVDIIDKQFFGYWYPIACLYLSGGNFEQLIVQPNVLQNYETMLRDPVTFKLFKKIYNFYYKFQEHKPAYQPEQIKMTNLKIVDVETTKFETYFDLVDMDATTLLSDKMVFADGKFVWDKTLLARQMRLNHEPFKFQIKVKSDIAQTVVGHIFAINTFDQLGKHVNPFDNLQDFILLDKFVFNLNAGENLIVRKSEDISYTVGDYPTYTEMYNAVMMAYEGKQEYPKEFMKRHCGFPQRLVLPRGSVNGMPMTLIYYFSPYTGQTGETAVHDYLGCTVGHGDRFIDNLPFGYPFDRKIEDIYQFFGPNILVQNTKIYHTEKYEKYYPKKYENFGTFDYTF